MREGNDVTPSRDPDAPEPEDEPTPAGDAATARAPRHNDRAERLEDWRAAERDADASKPGSARERLSRIQADGARHRFHESEDAEHVRQGDQRPRAPERLPEERSKEA